MKFFVKDFCETVQARVVIFGEQVDNDVLYCGIANQPSPAYYPLAQQSCGGDIGSVPYVFIPSHNKVVEGI